MLQAEAILVPSSCFLTMVLILMRLLGMDGVLSMAHVVVDKRAL